MRRLGRARGHFERYNSCGWQHCKWEIAGGEFYTHFVTGMMLDVLVASVRQAAACTIGTLVPHNHICKANAI